MIDWYLAIASGSTLPIAAAAELEARGYVVLPPVVPADRMERVSAAYSEAVESATAADLRVGSATTRVTDFVNRGPEFDDLYLFPPLLEASSLIICGPFKLSSFHARTLRPGALAQGLHVDVKRGSVDWPLVSFILMIDEFRPDNGATCFVPASHRREDIDEGTNSEALLAGVESLPACGAAGSLLIFNGSTWHGHGTNASAMPRRSLQGAFIPRRGRAGVAFGSRMQAATRTRLSPLAHYLLDLDQSSGP